MDYNPSGARLAVGSHDNNIYVYTCDKIYAKFAVLKAHTSFVTGFDWSLEDNPSYIRSNCGGYELLFFNVDSKMQDKGGASSTTGTAWAS
jgi:microtubule-associated protein-like 1/2